MIKNEVRRQFGRLPRLSQEGETMYLHLAVWRANVRLSKAPIFSSWCMSLWKWTRDPLDNGAFRNRTPISTSEVLMTGDESEEGESSGEKEVGEEEEWFVPGSDLEEGSDDD